jgi:hypothetical protein
MSDPHEREQESRESETDKFHEARVEEQEERAEAADDLRADPPSE